MIVNETKTKIMVFGKCNKMAEFRFNDRNLEVVNMYKYLGCIFNPCETHRSSIFKHMTKYLSDKAMKATFACVKKCSSVGYLSPKVGLHLFDTNVAPILNYASEIWYEGSDHDIEKIHLRFMKYLLGVKRSSCNLAAYGELGRFPIVLMQKVKLVKYWCRLELLKENSLLNMSYKLLKYSYNCGYNT